MSLWGCLNIILLIVSRFIPCLFHDTLMDIRLTMAFSFGETLFGLILFSSRTEACEP